MNFLRQSPRLRRRLLWAAGFGGLAMLALVLLGTLFPQQILTVDSGPVKAEVMVVLGGGVTERPLRAAELFKADEAPKVLVSGTGDCESNAQVLESNGVPAADIVLESKSRTTRENAEFTIALLRQRHLTNAIIVTSWYHSRRALACFEHYAPDIRFYSRPSYEGYWRKPEKGQHSTLNIEHSTSIGGETKAEEGGLGTEAGRKPAEWRDVRGDVELEYVKLLGYWIVYRVNPF